MWQTVKNFYHLGVAIAANIYYGFPGRKLTVIAVTGTDGKTTTVNMVYHILKSAGKHVSMISTVGAVIHGEASPLGFHVTNPSPFPLQRFLSLAATRKKLPKKENFLVLEVTSHGIDQHRIWGIPIELGLITNITEEHLDYHKTYENYAKTKIHLLTAAKIRVYNNDDKSARMITQNLIIHDGEQTHTFGIKTDADVTPKKIASGMRWDKYNSFTQYNMLAAMSACRLVCTDIPQKKIDEAVESFSQPKGRQDIVYQKDFSIMIDFAHTPNAFENILSSLHKSVRGKIIHVFGSAGERDSFKRPEMGKISSTYADVIILTSEDPRSERVEDIMDQIEQGMQKKKSLQLFREHDRQQAITKAVALAKKGDMVLITGKAHESSMNYGNGEEPWSDYEAVDKALMSIKRKV